MSITEIIKEIAKEETKKQQEIRMLLDDIQNVSSTAFAEECAERFTNQKHAYSIDGYISQLRKVIKLINAGANPQRAVEIVDSCIEIDSYLREMYGKGNANVR